MSEVKTKLRLGIAGLGLASSTMLPSIAAHSGYKLAAAVDPRSEARAQFEAEQQGVTYVNFEDLCKNQEIDVIYIATPHQHHKEQVIMAANYRKHIIVEKPLALTLEDCEAINEAVEQCGVKLVVGHTNSFDPAIIKMSEIVFSGELGRLGMVQTWNYTNFLYRPRRPEELDTSKGGGIIFNQVPHQIDMIRLIGGGMVKSVRAMTGIWDPSRPTEGSFCAFLEFQNGVGANAVYSGYDHFDMDELHGWISGTGLPKKPDTQGQARRALKAAATPEQELGLKYSGGNKYTADASTMSELYQPHFGITIASCERGDLKPSAKGLYIYDENGKREVPVPLKPAIPDKTKVLDELYNAVTLDVKPVHDGRWGQATMEVSLAILQSSRERREIELHQQVAVNVESFNKLFPSGE